MIWENGWTAWINHMYVAHATLRLPIATSHLSFLSKKSNKDFSHNSLPPLRASLQNPLQYKKTEKKKKRKKKKEKQAKMETTTTPELPTWTIVSDGGKHLEWSFSGRVPYGTSAQTPPQNLINSLPSMSNFVLQESSKIIGDVGSDERDVPMFRTGWGKSVTVKQSSIRKALSVLGEGEILERGSSKIIGESIVDDIPIFRTGSGKSVAVKQSSIRMALSVLGGGKILQGDQVHNAADHQCHSSNSLFQTSSGKMVNISSAGLIRAKTLLGLEENYNPLTSQGPRDTKKQSGTNGLSGWGKSQCVEKNASAILGTANIHSSGTLDASSFPKCPISCPRDKYSSGIGNQSKKDVLANLLNSDTCRSSSEQPPVKFQTAGGRSISVSSDALQRARNLLGESDSGISPNEDDTYDPLFLLPREEKTSNDNSLNKEDVSHASFLYQNATMNQYWGNRFPSHKGSMFNQKQSSYLLEATDSRDGILKHVDANGLASEGISRSNSNRGYMKRPPSDDLYATQMLVGNSSAKDLASQTIPATVPSGKPLVEISNSKETTCANQKRITSEKRRLVKKSFTSPFKRPRSSIFSTPLKSSMSFPCTGSSALPTLEGSRCKRRVSTRYPFQVKRHTVKEFFGGPPCKTDSLTHLSNEIKYMNADSAEKYIFHAASGLDGIGAEALRNMLAQCGASLLHATKEWVANHYKWIVWKLACLERGYPAHASGKFLTVPNVLEELKCRYEREVNHGHRSAVKRILEGDASPASMVVLCISAICSYPDSDPEIAECPLAPYEYPKKITGWSGGGAENNHVAKIELTDGWYSFDALLDAPLTKQLVAGKLFVGQKLRIWGAGLCGWVAPVSPLESSKTISLVMHINGTYRAHWADRLGFCKSIGAPLAFRCIKCAGGPVPRTLVGVTRIYPILYKERLANGGFVVRSERMEARMMQLYNQRCSTIAEGIMSQTQDIFGSHSNDDSDNEGAKIFKLLETAAEPEVLMADMSLEQLTSFATYQAKREAIRQSDMQKNVEKALNDAGLGGRQVTPLMRVRVVGLTAKCSQIKGCPREGLITIWNPTEKQVSLVEGQIYCTGGLVPLYSHANIIHFQARGSTTTWQHLPSSAVECFKPFFNPRKPILLSNLCEVPLASEFDTAAVIVYVGDVYLSGNQKKQWVFVTDGSESGSELQSEGHSICLLAICFCSSITENDAFTPVDHSILGSTVS
ncbi:protein BREAST CANCER SUSCEPTIBILITY 2 homolog B-like isoform X2 [Magnolia sinica]|uniref:protein BREAST CANCER SUSCEPTIBILITY 2 homolog B-like isoform X2 n=1 Tax=Magnolia sinica TaxID=86752 RepID=UPI00265A3F68|nr:protein BREAST CANCER SUSCEPTIBILITY 2 homolog B-like isoform X2 [Magnolia sinica]